jgi:hypothetical protein
MVDEWKWANCSASGEREAGERELEERGARRIVSGRGL